ncbi:MAG: hypothetical protein RBT11_10775 [Desulfobacterales bacterium]|jgi:hypothetical protein|nr:hypothetical protein [Desulfobacterales bacterium]
MKLRCFYIGTIALAVLLLHAGRGWTAFSEDLEKPCPKFSREGTDWIATLIPRGKSTSIQIRFHAEGAEINQVAAKEYSEAEAPLVNWKNFRSDFFIAKMKASAPGADVRFSIGSNYFTTATDLWAPVSVNDRTWGTTSPVNVGLKDRTNILTVTLRDGGPLDADGKADGKIEFICGPRDSFWGYAVGTLFIRFFGIFIVLGVLMAGMIFSGKIFQWTEAHGRTKKILVPIAPSPDFSDTLEDIPGIDPATAAAIAVALHLHSGASQPTLSGNLSTAGVSAWGHFGRGKLMNDRMPVFNRVQR